MPSHLRTSVALAIDPSSGIIRHDWLCRQHVAFFGENSVNITLAARQLCLKAQVAKNWQGAKRFKDFNLCFLAE